MSKFSYGPATWHMLESSGPERSTLQFYATTYSTNYHGGRQSKSCDQPKEYMACYKDTGYVSNCRPAIYYSPEVDAVENPPIRKLLEDNYDSLTCKDFVSYRVPSPNDPLPGKVISSVSGFSHNERRTFPTEKQVRDVYVDTRHGRGPIPLYPHHRPILYSYQRTSDPIAYENAGHGPKSMSTEYHTHFVKKNFNDGRNKSHASRKEDTGFTLAQGIEPVTFRPKENYANELPGYMTWRPTGTSVTRKTFIPPPLYRTGNEPLQALTSQGSRSSGFIKGNKAEKDAYPRTYERVGYTALHQAHPLLQQRILAQDPVEYTNMTHPHTHCTLATRQYEGLQHSPLSEPRRLGREEVGGKEMSGFSENNLPLVEPRDRDMARFATHYQNRFWDPTPKGRTRYGLVANGGGTLPPVGDGFTKSTHIHRRVPPPNQDLNAMDPYTARTVMKIEPSFDDHTHKHKDRAIAVATL